MKKAMKHELESKIELYLMHLKDDLARVRALKDTDNIDFKYARLSQLHSDAKALMEFTDIYLSDTFEEEE
jgi:hypothetical protein